MIDIYSLPSVRLSHLSRLPSIPSVYLACIGSTVLYVGKAVNLRSRHSEDRHHLYGLVHKTDKERRVLIRIRWLDFSRVVIPELSQETILLGFEESLITQFKPCWNSRLNGVRLNTLTKGKIMSQLIESNQSVQAQALQVVPPLNADATVAESILNTAIHLAANRSKPERFTKSEYNFSEDKITKDLIAAINGYAAQPLAPVDLVRMGLYAIAEKLRENGLPVETSIPDLSPFNPVVASTPGIQEMAKMIIKTLPELSLPEFVSRCTGKDSSEVHPIDLAILMAIRSSAQETL